MIMGLLIMAKNTDTEDVNNVLQMNQKIDHKPKRTIILMIIYLRGSKHLYIFEV
jgi:hypothetical protein